MKLQDFLKIRNDIKELHVVVTGGRNYSNAERMNEVLSSLRPYTVYQGGANGADKLAGTWAVKNSIWTRVFPANWAEHGRAAGPMRNQQMLNYARKYNAVVLAFPGGAGTKNCTSTAKDLQMTVIEIRD